MRIAVIVGAGIATVGGVGFWAGRDALAATETADVVAERPAQPVQVMTVAPVGMAEVATFTGTVRPRHEAALGFRIGGKLVERLVEVGAQVTAGQVLARLDDADARLDLATAEAEVAAARTDLDRAVAETGRAQDLFDRGHIAQAALDRATSAAAEASARLDRGEQRAAMARNALDYTTLRADADGVVLSTPGEAGQVVGASQTVVVVAETGAPDIVFALPEQDRGRLEGTTATAVLWGAEEETYPLTLRDVSPDVDPAGRTYRVRMTVQTDDPAVTFGRTATVTLAGDSAGAAGDGVIFLPLAAVMDEGSGPVIWRVVADRVEPVPVTILALLSDRIAVTGPLAEGDTVISIGAHKIDPDRPVRVVETLAPMEG
jgi:RND family efflux transporter MFP subunit